MMLVISASERLRSGMTDPGFSPGGLRSQRRRSGSVFSKMHPEKQARLLKWVRFGPTVPAEMPETVWQPAQPLERNRLAPVVAGSVLVVVVGSAAGAAC